jgi:hypothetical protein
VPFLQSTVDKLRSKAYQEKVLTIADAIRKADWIWAYFKTMNQKSLGV